MKNNETHEEEQRERICYFSGVDDFEEKMKYKRSSLCDAIKRFIAEGPLLTTSETIPGGNKDCEIDSNEKNTMNKRQLSYAVAIPMRCNEQTMA